MCIGSRLGHLDTCTVQEAAVLLVCSVLFCCYVGKMWPETANPTLITTARGCTRKPCFEIPADTFLSRLACGSRLVGPVSLGQATRTVPSYEMMGLQVGPMNDSGAVQQRAPSYCMHCVPADCVRRAKMQVGLQSLADAGRLHEGPTQTAWLFFRFIPRLRLCGAPWRVSTKDALHPPTTNSGTLA